MATPTFAINSGNSLPGMQADWQRVPKRKNVDGTIDYQPWSRHWWDIEEMEMSEYETLQALSGTVLTSLDTTDIDDKNNGATYTSAEVGVVNCRQQGRQARGVRVEFRVKA